MDIPLSLPNDPVSPAPVDPEQGAAARRLAFALGPMYQGADGTLIAQDFLAIGGALALTRRANINSINEAFADTAIQLLSELEVIYGLTVRTDLTTAQRQARLLATIRARISAAPTDIVTAIRALDPNALIVEYSAAQMVAADPNPVTRPTTLRGVFRFGVFVTAATYANPTLVAQIDAVMQKMKPAHTNYTLGVQGGGFLCDDPNSLTDRDLLAT